MNRADWDRVEALLTDTVICKRCGATLATYDDACSAPLDEACPGFIAIEAAAAARRATGA